MKQLGGLDSVFVHAEQLGLPMHISSFSIYDPSTAPNQTDSSIPKNRVHFQRIVEFYRTTIIDKLPILRSKLIKVPMNLDQPYWVEDPDFNIEYHMRYSALPAPGNWESLCQHLAQLHAQPLNRHFPLWEAHIIDGLHTAMDVPEGCFGVLFKVHHAIMDGATGMAIFTSLHSLENRLDAPSGQEEVLPLPKAESRPGSWELLSKAYVHNTSRTYKLAKILTEAVSTYKKIRKEIGERRLRLIENKPKTRFNASISQHRTMNRIKVAFADIRQIRGLVPGATVNDVALSIIGGALRKYLVHHRELPCTSLVASTPINVRSKRQEPTDDTANLLSIMNCILGTHIADPKMRLQQVHKGSQLSKQFADAMGHDLLNDLSDCMYAPLTSWGLRKLVETGLLSLLPPASHTVVTNVPGVPIPFYLCGCEMVDSFGLGPLIPNTGLFHTVSSTYDQFSISVVADRRMMPDSNFYRECLMESFTELLEISRGVRTATAAKTEPAAEPVADSIVTLVETPVENNTATSEKQLANAELKQKPAEKPTGKRIARNKGSAKKYPAKTAALQKSPQKAKQNRMRNDKKGLAKQMAEAEAISNDMIQGFQKAAATDEGPPAHANQLENMIEILLLDDRAEEQESFAKNLVANLVNDFNDKPDK